jgi:4-carboxymuconolactone decarboxylase
MSSRHLAVGELALTDDRYERGLEKLLKIHGKEGERFIENVKVTAPDMARFIVEFVFGDVYSRPALDVKSREIVTVTALTALGNAQPELKVHLHAALNVGCSRAELVEVMIQLAVYAGFPAALNGIATLKKVFEERDKKPA